MAVPTAYTELMLAVFMDAVLGPVGDVLGYVFANGDYTEAINETLLAYGVTDISLITGAENTARLRALARVAIWRQVVDHSAGDYAFSADGGTYSREQIHTMAQENLARAETLAARYDPNYRVGVDTLVYKHDPYSTLDEETRTR